MKMHRLFLLCEILLYRNKENIRCSSRDMEDALAVFGDCFDLKDLETDDLGDQEDEDDLDEEDVDDLIEDDLGDEEVDEEGAAHDDETGKSVWNKNE